MNPTEQTRRKKGAKARDQARRHERAAGRGSAPRDFWRRQAAPLRHVGEDELRVWSLRRGKQHLLLGGVATFAQSGGSAAHWGGLVEQVTWDDVTAILTGQMTLRTDPYNPKPLDVLDGDEVTLEHRLTQGARWREVWTMRVSNPSYDFAAGSVVFELANDLALLNASSDDFDYSTSKKRKRGWLVHEAMIDLARRYGLRAKIVKTKHRIKKQGIGRGVNVWEFVKKLRNYEAVATNRRLVLRYDRKTLTMRPLRRSPYMLLLGPTLISAALTKTRYERFATSVTVRTTNWEQKGRDPKKRKKRKIHKAHASYTNSAAVRRYGRVHRILYSPDATSTAELRNEGRMYIAAAIIPDRQLTFSHPAIPMMKRGDALTISLPDAGLKQIVFAQELHFRIGGGEFFMDGVAQFDDPYVDQRELNILDKLADQPSSRYSEKAPKKKKKKTPTPNQNRAAKPKTPKETPGQNLSRRYGGT